MSPRLVPIMLSLGVASCSVGHKVDNFLPAHQPQGAEMELRVGEAETVRVVELLAVTDTALLVRDSTGIALVSLTAIRAAKTTAPGSGVRFGGSGPTPSRRERLRLLSRYPQGVSTTLLGQLLEAYQQARLEVVSR